MFPLTGYHSDSPRPGAISRTFDEQTGHPCLNDPLVTVLAG